MIRVGNSKSIVCSKKELRMIESFIDSCWAHIYELPLFTLCPNDMSHRINDIQTDFVVIRPINTKLSEQFMNKINKTWNKLYES